MWYLAYHYFFLIFFTQRWLICTDQLSFTFSRKDSLKQVHAQLSVVRYVMRVLRQSEQETLMVICSPATQPEKEPNTQNMWSHKIETYSTLQKIVHSRKSLSKAAQDASLLHTYKLNSSNVNSNSARDHSNINIIVIKQNTSNAKQVITSFCEVFSQKGSHLFLLHSKIKSHTFYTLDIFKFLPICLVMACLFTEIRTFKS